MRKDCSLLFYSFVQTVALITIAAHVYMANAVDSCGFRSILNLNKRLQKYEFGK